MILFLLTDESERWSELVIAFPEPFNYSDCVETGCKCPVFDTTVNCGALAMLSLNCRLFG